MSSTNDIDLRIQSIFERFVDVDENAHQLLTTIDKNAESYYEAPKHPEQAYLSFIDVSTETNFNNYLSEFWGGTPDNIYGPMSAALSELAFMLQAGEETQSDEVSSFVYTMY